jgi:acyl-CoA synthetase (AMP-forming)/AMP-acid ligase II
MGMLLFCDQHCPASPWIRSWVRTGDEGKIREDGEVFILDRLKVRHIIERRKVLGLSIDWRRKL